MDIPNKLLIENDREILVGLKSGDQKAFELIFKAYYSGLCNFANGFLKSFDSAEEIVQEVFINYWNKHAKIEIFTSIKSYLFRCVYNACLNYIRDHKKINHNTVLLDENNQQTELLLIATSNTAFTNMLSEEIEKELKSAIENLPEQCRKIFCLSRFENLSYIEIAKLLGITVSTVKTQMSRAMTKLMKNMDKHF